ncbi:hypothetical protein TWF225_011180 [Orbilia oligospora]|nr:hypothetical protein TWF751_000526 [Orbilia oligospora]KAF3169965.1 hypothetical protein TWF225_011180 [Orbilia oligospora]KAF3248181.1 hypothetical protein TWF217_009156 [Orbilia oligospora]KAF3250443.1 hypothetical protein TWF128_007583 [Orbilia oligospora]KAF3285089.1 hypothetical protein TWF132_009632 [Orbilia oligospora]
MVSSGAGWLGHAGVWKEIVSACQCFELFVLSQGFEGYFPNSTLLVYLGSTLGGLSKCFRDVRRSSFSSLNWKEADRNVPWTNHCPISHWLELAPVDPASGQAT